MPYRPIVTRWIRLPALVFSSPSPQATRKRTVVAKRPLATLARRPGRASAANYSQRVISLLSQRDDLMNEILAMRSRPPLVKKAGTLLTRFWARADWQAREEILQSARWLVKVGKIQSAMTPAKVR